jgi:hypothetical protein
MDLIRGMVDRSGDEIFFQRYLASFNCTHLLVRYDLFQQFLQDNYDPKKIEQLEKQMNRALKTVYDDNKYRVFSVIRR